MAFTRGAYDQCYTKDRTERSTSMLSYQLDPNKYYNCTPCRIEFGVVGGNNVSLYKGNMVDLSSELSGRTRGSSRCPSSQYLPGTIIQGRDVGSCPRASGEGLPCGPVVTQDKLAHLPECSLIQYKARPSSVGYELKFPACATKGTQPEPSKPKLRPNPFVPIEWQGQQGQLARY